MDAVRTTIRELGGEVLMTSEPGQGTEAQIRLPLTLAIMAALLVEADGRAVRDPARPHRAHRPPRRPHRPLGRRRAGCWSARRRAADRRRRRAVRRRRPRRRPSYAVIVRGAAPARSRSPSPRSSASASWSRAPLPPEVAEDSALSGGRRAVRRADRADRRLRRAVGTDRSHPTCVHRLKGPP